MLDKIASFEGGRKSLQDSLDEVPHKRKAQRFDKCLRYIVTNRPGDKRRNR